MITFQVKPDDGEEFELEAGSRDVLLWERTGRGRSFSGLMDEQRMSDLYALAHVAARRQQLFAGTLEEFESTCELRAEEGEEPDPTEPDRSEERS